MPRYLRCGLCAMTSKDQFHKLVHKDMSSFRDFPFFLNVSYYSNKSCSHTWCVIYGGYVFCLFDLFCPLWNVLSKVTSNARIVGQEIITSNLSHPDLSDCDRIVGTESVWTKTVRLNSTRTHIA